MQANAGACFTVASWCGEHSAKASTRSQLYLRATSKPFAREVRYAAVSAASSQRQHLSVLRDATGGMAQRLLNEGVQCYWVECTLVCFAKKRRSCGNP